jgi:hypothetical protein
MTQRGEVNGAASGPGTAGVVPRFGAQLWVDPDDDAGAIDRRVEAAARSGLSVLRIFLVWPYIEPTPGDLEFSLYDEVFAAAARHGIGICATLGPDSRPWHQGAPGLVQSQPRSMPSAPDERPAIEHYLIACVERYRAHPALREWILWNEPMRPGTGPGAVRDFAGEAEREVWQEVLSERYRDIEQLNRRWHTGYRRFADVPHPSQVVRADQARGPFFSYAPWLDEAAFRARGLATELRWVRDVIRRLDPRTSLTFNPAGLFDNPAAAGYDYSQLGGIAPVLGGSLHAPWHFTFAEPADHTALIAAGVGLLRSASSTGRAELTEMQGGNVISGAPGAGDVTPAAVARGFLAAAFAGAESVITWALNGRSADFEAGDWGMLDDDDTGGPVLSCTAKAQQAVEALSRAIGPFAPAVPTVLALIDERSAAVEHVQTATSLDTWGQNPHRSATYAASVVTQALRLGYPASPVTPAGLGRLADPSATTVVVPYGIALGEDAQTAIAEFLAADGHLVVDGMFQRFGPDATWNTAQSFARTHGYVVKRQRRHERTPVFLQGTSIGSFPGPWAVFEFTDQGWTADDAVTAGQDHEPAVFHRTVAKQHLTLVSGVLSALADGSPTLIRHVLAAGRAASPEARSLGGAAITLKVVGERGAAYAVLGQEVSYRGGSQLTVRVPHGRYHDLWSDRPLTTDRLGHLTLEAPDGIAVLVPGTGDTAPV